MDTKLATCSLGCDDNAACLADCDEEYDTDVSNCPCQDNCVCKYKFGKTIFIKIYKFNDVIK